MVVLLCCELVLFMVFVIVSVNDVVYVFMCFVVRIDSYGNW